MWAHATSYIPVYLLLSLWCRTKDRGTMDMDADILLWLTCCCVLKLKVCHLQQSFVSRVKYRRITSQNIKLSNSGSWSQRQPVWICSFEQFFRFPALLAVFLSVVLSPLIFCAKYQFTTCSAMTRKSTDAGAVDRGFTMSQTGSKIRNNLPEI
jgi:hypothetical protein